MYKVFAAKQVGPISYMVDKLGTLIEILKSQKILSSRLAEKNPKTGERKHYVSFSRSMTAASSRNKSRWYCGVIIDGTELSNRYHIEPYSFAGAGYDTSTFRVKYVAKYDNGDHTLAIVNWPTMRISETMYNMIVNEIEAMSDTMKDKKRLTYQGPSNAVRNGRRILEKYTFNVKNGGLVLNSRTMPKSFQSMLLKHDKVNEMEERIWTDDRYIDISGCIVGIILPKEVAEELESSDLPEIDSLYYTAIKVLGDDFKIVTY